MDLVCLELAAERSVSNTCLLVCRPLFKDLNCSSVLVVVLDFVLEVDVFVSRAFIGFEGRDFTEELEGLDEVHDGLGIVGDVGVGVDCLLLEDFKGIYVDSSPGAVDSVSFEGVDVEWVVPVVVEDVVVDFEWPCRGEAEVCWSLVFAKLGCSGQEWGHGVL